MTEPKPRGFIALALNAEVRAAGNRWRHELVPLEDVDERLSHAAIKAITAYLEDLKGASSRASSSAACARSACLAETRFRTR
jgi:predicted secreted protein